MGDLTAIKESFQPFSYLFDCMGFLRVQVLSPLEHVVYLLCDRLSFHASDHPMSVLGLYLVTVLTGDAEVEGEGLQLNEMGSIKCNLVTE